MRNSAEGRRRYLEAGWLAVQGWLPVPLWPVWKGIPSTVRGRNMSGIPCFTDEIRGRQGRGSGGWLVTMVTGWHRGDAKLLHTLSPFLLLPLFLLLPFPSSSFLFSFPFPSFPSLPLPAAPFSIFCSHVETVSINLSGFRSRRARVQLQQLQFQ